MKQAVWLVCCLLWCVACAAPVPFTAERNGIRVAVTVDERTLGFRSGTIVATATDGAAVTPEAVTLTAVMAQHGMVLPPMTLRPSVDGYSYERLEINMVGEWQFQIRVTQNGTTTVVEVPIVFE